MKNLRFDWQRFVALFGWVVSTGVVVVLAPERYKPLAAFAGTVITGLLQSPTQPEIKSLTAALGYGEKFLAAVEPALPAKYRAGISPAEEVLQTVIDKGEAATGGSVLPTANPQ